MTTTYAPARQSLVGHYFRRLGIDTQYVLLGFPLGLITVTLFMTAFFTGVGTAIIWVGFPVLVATLMMARGFAVVERARIAPILGRKIPHPHYKKNPEGDWLRRTLTPLTDGQSWLDLLHGMFRFIPSTIGFSLVFTWWIVALSGLTVWAWDWSIP
ncbi:MAG: sensor domain-containing protein, partial [Actinoplanes sp.]